MNRHLLALGTIALPAFLVACSADVVVHGEPADVAAPDGSSPVAPPDPPEQPDVPPGTPGAPLASCEGPAHPSAMLGNTPARTMRSTFDVPSSASLKWSVDLGGSARGRVSLDREGRAYIGVDTRPIDSAIITNRITALDVDGTVAWVRDYDTPISGAPILAENGDLLVVVGGYLDRELVRMSRDGVDLSRSDLADDVGSQPAIRCGDTLLWRTFKPGDEPVSAVVTASDGTLRWRSPAYSDSMSWLATDQAGQSYAEWTVDPHPWTQTLVALDPTGVERWRFERPESYGPIGPAVDDAGRVFTVTYADGVVSLHALSSEGEALWTVGLEDDPAYVPLVIAPDGTIVLRTFKTVHAIRDGKVLWQRDFHQNIAFEMELGNNGRLVITSGAVVALDLATGAELWRVEEEALGSWICIDPMVITDAGVLFSTCDGVAHLVGD